VRDFVVPDNIEPAQVIERIIAMVPPPTPVWNGQQQAPSNVPRQPDFN